MRIPAPGDRARAVLAVTAIGMSGVVFSLSGVAQAASTPWSASLAGPSDPIPAGICFVDWVVEGGSGGGATAGLGGRLDLRTEVQAGDVFLLQPGGAGAAATADAGGAGGQSDPVDATVEGATGTSAADGAGTGGGGGGAASTVRLTRNSSTTDFLSAFGGDGAPGLESDNTTVVLGGQGGGGDLNTASTTAIHYLAPEQEAEQAGAAGDGSITATGIPCRATAVEGVAGDGQLTVSFTPAPGTDADTWDISVDGGHSTYTTMSTASFQESGGVLSTTLTSLTNGTPYALAVRSTGAAGTSPWAVASGPSTPAAAPAAPTLSNSRGRDGSLLVDITPVTDAGKPDATGWEYQLGGSGPWTTLSTTTSNGVLTGTVTGLQNGQTHYVSVRGTAGTGGALKGAPSGQMPAFPQAAPAAPTAVTVAARDQGLEVAFQPGATAPGTANPTGWEISTDGGTTFMGFGAGVNPNTGLTTGYAYGLLNGQTYSVVVRATSPVGPGASSTPVSGTPAGVPNPPIGNPSDPSAPYLAYAQGMDRSIELFLSTGSSYAGAPTPTGYEYRLDGGAWTPLTTRDGGSGKAATISGLTNGRAYAVQVRALAGQLTSLPSQTITVTPRYWLPEPGDVRATVLPGALKVTWTAPAGAVGLTGYEVHASPVLTNRHSVVAVEDVVVCAARPTETTCVLPVPAGKQYDVSVMGVGADGPGFAGYVESQVVPAVQKPTAVPTRDDGDLTGANGPITSAVAGQKVLLRGTGYLPGSIVELLVFSTPVSLGTVVAGPDGSFSVEVTLPAGLEAGTHHLVATGVDQNGNVRNLVIEVAVTADGTATITRAEDAGLAYTGADIAVPAIGGLAALAIGGGLVLAGRRKRAAE